eukprot:SAG11_NODE_1364_length_5109_cov_2.966866_8_plen_82_part_00
MMRACWFGSREVNECLTKGEMKFESPVFASKQYFLPRSSACVWARYFCHGLYGKSIAIPSSLVRLTVVEVHRPDEERSLHH